jgi:hypothetical protein
MKSRRVSFHIGEELTPDLLAGIDHQVLPRFSEMANFLGFLALESEEGSRREIIAISLWDDGIEGSEEISEEFRREIRRVAGSTSSARTYNLLRVMVRDANGDICLDASSDISGSSGQAEPE